MPRWKVAGISFDHMHMGDNLRMAFEHPNVEIVGLCDEQPQRMVPAAKACNIASDRLFTNERELFAKTEPDIVLLCPATARHGEWVSRLAPYGCHVLIEKPFAASLAEADAMIAALRKTGKLLAINWPLAWVPAHVTTKRLIDEGTIGEVIEVHYYDGNRGPLWHVAGKKATTPEEIAKEKPHSWFYKKDQGGGSLLDYLGYGVTLGTWFLDGRIPLEVTTVVDAPAGLEVDEHSITVARYSFGLSKFETRWGTFTDPWTNQPQPRCGFVLVGTQGTISSYDYAPQVRVQTKLHPDGEDIPVDVLKPPYQNPVQYVVHCLETGQAISGPLSPELSRIGQVVVDAAIQSACEKRTIAIKS
ncbi:MAG: Gfo/Idh/MocA family protein [Gemmataceae bacterium]